MKSVNLQCMYGVPDEYPWVARNRDGILCGFRHAPVRDYQAGHGEWIDSVDGSHGEIIEYADWEKSVREVSTLVDIRKNTRTVMKNRQWGADKIRENKQRKKHERR